jgi:hypothetical protein
MADELPEDWDAWIEDAAAAIAGALKDPAIRADVSALMVGSGPDVKRRRRLEDLREELAGFELAWQRREGESDA